MIVGIMQPYFFPYIGYWQLINSVDSFVIYDDVNYIKGGWINRNRILNSNKEVGYLNLYLYGASSFKKINEIQVNNDKKLIDKNLKTIKMVYGKAEYFESVFPIFEKIISNNEDNLAHYNTYLIKTICEYLCINTKILISSDIEKNPDLKGESRVIDICKRLGATEYYNAIGGKELYSTETFGNAGIKLSFLKTEPIIYKQFNGCGFFENLSIIDVMMFNSKERVQELLQLCSLA